MYDAGRGVWVAPTSGGVSIQTFGYIAIRNLVDVISHYVTAYSIYGFILAELRCIFAGYNAQELSLYDFCREAPIDPIDISITDYIEVNAMPD